MKRVFSNTDDVIHIWAQQKQDTVRNGSGSISSDGETLISYNTPVARFYTNDRGETVVLITSLKYSVTTSQQLSSAAYAVRHHTVLNVMHIRERPIGRAPYLNIGETWHDANLKDLQKRYEDALLKLSRAKTNVDLWERELSKLVDTASRYCEFFDLYFDRHAFPAVNSDEMQEVKARAQKAIKEKSAQTAAKNKQRRESLDSIIDQLEADGDDRNLPWDWKSFATGEQQKRILTIAETMWLKDGDTVRGVELRDLPAMLRINGEEVETSWRATFPIEHAEKAFTIIHHCREAGITWKANGHTIHLGHYALDSINERGDVVAGCHTVYWSAIERVARQLGLIA